MIIYIKVIFYYSSCLELNFLTFTRAIFYFSGSRNHFQPLWTRKLLIQRLSCRDIIIDINYKVGKIYARMIEIAKYLLNVLSASYY